MPVSVLERAQEGQAMNCEQRFERDIPSDLRESVMEMIAEAAQGIGHAEVAILDMGASA